MSKVNRRKEIREKEELQARFQTSIARNNSKVLGWLDVGGGVAGSEADTEANVSFLGLPIVRQGAGLSSLESDAATIGDYVNDVKSIKQASESAGRVSSKPMQALLNRMRDTGRSNAGGGRGRVQKAGGVAGRKPQRQGGARPAPGPVAGNGDDDSDDDATLVQSRGVKKSAAMFVGKKSKKPF